MEDEIDKTVHLSIAIQGTLDEYIIQLDPKENFVEGLVTGLKCTTYEDPHQFYRMLKHDPEKIVWLLLLVYDGTVVDWEATPEVLMMEENDSILVMEKSFFDEIENANKRNVYYEGVGRCFKNTWKGKEPRCDAFPLIPLLAEGLGRLRPKEENRELSRHHIRCTKELLLESFNQVVNSGLQEIESKLQDGSYEYLVGIILDLDAVFNMLSTQLSGELKKLLYQFLHLLGLYGNIEQHSKLETEWKSFLRGKSLDQDIKILIICPVGDRFLPERSISLSWAAPIYLPYNKLTRAGLAVDLTFNYQFYINYTSLNGVEPNSIKITKSSVSNSEFSVDDLVDESDGQESVFKFQKQLDLPQIFYFGSWLHSKEIISSATSYTQKVPKCCTHFDLSPGPKTDKGEEKLKKKRQKARKEESIAGVNFGDLKEYHGDKDLKFILNYVEGEESTKKKKNKKKKKIRGLKEPEAIASDTTQQSSEEEEVTEEAREKNSVVKPETLPGVESESFQNNEGFEGTDDSTDFTVFTKKRKAKGNQNDPKTFYITTNNTRGEASPKYAQKNFSGPSNRAYDSSFTQEIAVKNKNDNHRKIEPNGTQKNIDVAYVKSVQKNVSGASHFANDLPTKQGIAVKNQHDNHRKANKTSEPLKNKHYENAVHDMQLNASVKKTSTKHDMEAKKESDHKNKMNIKLLQLQEEYQQNEKTFGKLRDQEGDMLGNLNTKLERCEDNIHHNQKTCSKIDADIEEVEVTRRELEARILQLDNQRREMEARKSEILLNNSKLEEEREKHRQDRIQLEHKVERKMSLLLDKKRSLLQSIKVAKQEIDHSHTETKSKTEKGESSDHMIKKVVKVDINHLRAYECADNNKDPEKSKTELNSDLLDFLQEQIKAGLNIYLISHLRNIFLESF